MCGIAGIFDPARGADHDVVRKMQARIVHRGPDGEGFFAREGIAMAMRRLAIIDRAGGAQPVFNEDRSVVVVYNGEIYNHHELRKELEAKGHRFHSRVDTEVIVHLYEEEGPACVKRLDGMFAFSLWDEKRRELLIARDRFGIKPLFYARSGGRISWASEIASLREDDSIGAGMDLDALEMYLTLYYIPPPATIFESIRSLRPAHYLIASERGVRFERYWKPEYSTARISEEDACEGIRARLHAAVLGTLESEVPLGVFLSGGLDSTAVAAYAQESLGKMRTYSLGFEGNPSYDERHLSRLVAKQYGTEHQEIVLAPDDVPRILDKLAKVYGNPIGDWSAVLNYKICEEAKKTSTVILRGDGGDELLGGYPTLIASMVSRYYMKLPAAARGVLERIVDMLPPSDDYLSFDFKLKKFVHGARHRTDIAHLAWKEIFAAERRKRLCPAIRGSGDDPYDRMIAPLWDDLKEYAPMDGLLYLDANVFLAGLGLIHSDHTAMAHSVETRVPFLTNEFADFANALPFHYKVSGKTTKSVYRKAMAPVLPKRILAGSKRGFSAPGVTWLRKELKETAREIIARAPDFLDRREAMAVLEEHQSGRRDASREVTALINLVLWSEAN